MADPATNDDTQRSTTASVNQAHLDKEMKQRGQRAWQSAFYRRMESGDASTLAPLRHLAGGIHEDLAAHLKRIAVSAPKPGRYAKGKWALAHYVLASTPEDVASVIIGTTMNLTMRTLAGITFSSYAKIVGERVKDHVRQSAYMAAFPIAAYDYIDRAKRERVRNRKVKRRHVRKIFDKIEGFDPAPDIDISDAAIGAASWHLLQKTVNIWEVQMKPTSRGNIRPWVVMTSAAYFHVRDLAGQFADRRITPLPMVDKPKDWDATSPWGGGYPKIGKRAIVRGWTRKDAELVGMNERTYGTDVKLSNACDAVNLVQRTAYRMNPTVLEAHNWIIENDINCTLNPKFVERPEFDGSVWEDDKARQMARRAIKMYRLESEANHPQRTRAAVDDLHMRMFAGAEFYLPAACGMYGRITYRPTINPQRSKGVRGCIEFANAEPLVGDEAVRQLMISVANEWGQDKGTLDQRVSWVEDNTAMLLRVASNYQRHQEWLDTDAPTMALRAALEWAKFKEEGHDLRSHYICYRDQTCSGPSHYASMLRDSSLYSDLGLAATPHRPDVYTLIAQRGVKLASEVGTDVCEAIARHGIERSKAKNVVVPGAYGGTKLGTYRKLRDELIIRTMLEEEALPYPDVYAYAKALNEILWVAFDDVMGRQRQAMHWFRNVAGVFASHNTPVTWVGPSGLPLKLAKWKQKERTIETMIGEQLYRPTYWRDTDELDARLMKNSLPVAFVHSYEAGFLHNVLSRLGSMPDPVQSVVSIHDCVGVHAGAVEQTLGVLRDEWTAQYQGEDIINRQHAEWATLHNDIQDAPQVGVVPFNLTDTNYFFH
jgi:DNA-directed RNA polymerase